MVIFHSYVSLPKGNMNDWLEKIWYEYGGPVQTRVRIWNSNGLQAEPYIPEICLLVEVLLWSFNIAMENDLGLFTFIHLIWPTGHYDIP